MPLPPYRFGRSVREILENVQTLDRCRVRFLVSQQGLYTRKESDGGRVFIATLRGVAEMERTFSLQRTQAGYQAYRKAHSSGSMW